MSSVESTFRVGPAFAAQVAVREHSSDGFIDAVIAAGALAAWADGSVRPVERLEMLVYMRRAGLATLRRRDVLEIFDHRVQALKRDPTAAVQATRDLLGAFSGNSVAWTVLRAAEHVAAADSRIMDSEVLAIHSVRTALGLSSESLELPLSM